MPLAIYFAAEAGKMEEALIWVVFLVAIALGVIATINYWSNTNELLDRGKVIEGLVLGIIGAGLAVMFIIIFRLIGKLLKPLEHYRIVLCPLSFVLCPLSLLPPSSSFIPHPSSLLSQKVSITH